MAYMNRVATLTSGGRRVAPVAVLYHGESEWAGPAMLSQEPAASLAEAQIEYDTLPADVFAEPEHYRTVPGSPLRVNTQEYRALVAPQAGFCHRRLCPRGRRAGRSRAAGLFYRRTAERRYGRRRRAAGTADRLPGAGAGRAGPRPANAGPARSAG